MSKVNVRSKNYLNGSDTGIKIMHPTPKTYEVKENRHMYSISEII